MNILQYKKENVKSSIYRPLRRILLQKSYFLTNLKALSCISLHVALNWAKQEHESSIPDHSVLQVDGWGYERLFK